MFTKIKNFVAMNKKLFIAIGLIVVILVSICFGFALKSNAPKIEQIKNDFIGEKLDAEFSVTDFEIEAETDGEGDYYKAIVKVTYDNELVEFSERYHFIYNKYDEWILEDIEDYEEDSWTKKPLVAPTIEEFKEICISELSDYGEFIEYDTFEALNNKTEVDLDGGKTKFVFEVKNESILQNVSGEIEFEVLFNNEIEKWRVESFNYADSYIIEHNLKHIWTGKASHNGYYGTEKEFTLTITEYNDKEGTGILTYDGNSYSVSGKITMPDEAGDKIRIDLCNVDEKMRVEGSITIEGEMDVTVYTTYNPDSRFYFLKDSYTVDMTIKE